MSSFIHKSMILIELDQLDSLHDSCDTDWRLQPVPKIVWILLDELLLYEAKNLNILFCFQGAIEHASINCWFIHRTGELGFGIMF